MLRAELLAPLDGTGRAKWLKTKSARLAGFARAKWVFRGCEAGERLCALGLVKVDPDAVHGDADIESHHPAKEVA